VQVQDAIAQETDNVDRSTSNYGQENPFDEIRRVDDTHILVRNVDPRRVGVSRFDYSSIRNYWTFERRRTERYTLTLRQSAIAIF